MIILFSKCRVKWLNDNALWLAILIAVVFNVEASIAQPLESIFPDQRLVYKKEQKERIYFLTLGPLEKINGKWGSDREEPVKSRVAGKTFEISHPYDLKSAWLSVQKFFTDKGASLVFECLGLECGSSNAWANERFEVPLLYGLDLSQRYQVWQWRVGGKPNIAVVYLVQRGNQRMYFHVDRLWPHDNDLSIAPGASVIAKRFYSGGHITVAGLQFENGNLIADQNYIESLARALNEKPFLLLEVVGFDAFPGTQEERQVRSLAHAQRVVELLIKKGVRGRRMKAKAGGENPRPDPGSNAKVVVQLRTK